MPLKVKVLGILEKNRGKSISGEEIAKAVKKSRAAVWKAVQGLKKEGYKIDAATNKGYSLSIDNDFLSTEGIQPYLHDKNIAALIHVKKILESTSQEAKKMALEGALDKTVVLSEEQTSGRARMGRSFFSPPNCGVYMSIVLRPKISLASSLLVTTAVSVAVCRAIEAVTGISVQIKWVNDIFADRKKICGILTEAFTDFESGAVEYIIVGIGINFNTPSFLFPEEIRKTAGSLYDEKISGVSRNRLAAEIINRVVGIIPCLEQREFLAEYRRRSMLLKKEIQFISSGQLVNAVALDIDGDGGLMVQEEDGSVRTLNSGEVSIRRID